MGHINSPVRKEIKAIQRHNPKEGSKVRKNHAIMSFLCKTPGISIRAPHTLFSFFVEDYCAVVVSLVNPAYS